MRRLLELQRSAGNRAVGRYLARQTRDAPDLEYVPPEPGSKLPQAASDPRAHSDYIDNRMEAVGYSPYNGYVLFLRDAPEQAVLVPEDHFDFGASPAVAASPVIHPTREAAFAAVPAGPLQEGQAVPYALYRGALGLVVPTTISMATAPRTTATARDASSRYATEVADELAQAVVMIAGFTALTVGLRAVFRFGGARFEAKLGKAPKGRGEPTGASPPPEGAPPPAPKPAQAPPATPPRPLKPAVEFRADIIERLFKLRRGSKDLPAGHSMVTDLLAESKSPANQKILELLPEVQRALGSPELYADLLVIAREVAAEQNISISDALWQMSLEGGARAMPIPASKGELPGGVFFKRYAIERGPIIDEGAGAAHGKLTHPLQDMVITRGLRRAGRSETAYDFRALLGEAEGQLNGVSAGDWVWRMTYDTIDKGHINMPETLVEALGPVGLR